MYRDGGYWKKGKSSPEPPEVIDVPTTPQPQAAPVPPPAADVQPVPEPPTPPPSSSAPHCGTVSPKPKPKKPKESLPFQDFWDLYDKKRDRPASERLWTALPIRDQRAIMEYIPKYKDAQPEKRFRKDPTTFLRHRSWEDELISDHKQPVTNRPNPTILQPRQVESDDVEEW